MITIYFGPTPFSYIIIDTTNKSRTIINTPGQDLEESEVSPENLIDAVCINKTKRKKRKKLGRVM